MKSFRLETLYIVVRIESKISNFSIIYNISLEDIVENVMTKSKEIIYIGCNRFYSEKTSPLGSGVYNPYRSDIYCCECFIKTVGLRDGELRSALSFRCLW